MKQMGWVLSGLVAVAIVASGCASSSGEHDTHGGIDHTAMFADAEGEAFDLQFIDAMIVHHEGAIDMSEEANAQVENEELRTFAQVIIDAQVAEVAQMKAWREAWYPAAPLTLTDGMEMGAMEVSLAPGRSYDQRWLESMISHHEGAVAMAVAAQERASHSELRTFAEAVIDVQTREIETMDTWLHDWFEVED